MPRTRLRSCPRPGCGELIPTGRRYCATHSREYEQARGTRQQRGYNTQHDTLRAHWQPFVEAGRVNCWRCNQRIQPGTPWDLGHDDRDRDIHRGPEHAACNRAAAGHSAHGG